MHTKNKETFTVNGVEYAVLRPNNKHHQQAQKYWNLAFNDAVASKALLREKIEEVMREQNLWDDNKQKEFERLQKEINDNLLKLAKGKMKACEGRLLAIKIRDLRTELRDLTWKRISLDNNSAQAQADNARFNYLVSACTVYNDSGKLVFASYEDYLERAADDLTIRAAETLGNMIYGLNKNWEHELPEVKFLKKYKFVNEDLHFVNKEGKLVDREGRLVNKDGKYVDGNGNLVDATGNPVDEQGNYVFEDAVFYDDDGKPAHEEMVATVAE